MENTLESRINNFIQEVNQLQIKQQSDIERKAQLEESIKRIVDENALTIEELDLYQKAIVILREVSDDTVRQSYEFITENINNALERIFDKTIRKIRLHEYTRAGQYPQLEIILTVEGGKTRSLKSGSGHGLMQIVSLLCILCIIVITKSRRLLVIDEVLSGLSAKARRIVAEILWTFTEIGFQFIISEHGFIPKGSKVYRLQMDGGVSHIEDEYIEQNGVYLNGEIKRRKDSGDDQVVVMGEAEDDETAEVARQAMQTVIENESAHGAVESELKSGSVIQI